MAMSDLIKSAGVISGSKRAIKQNTPPQYGDRQKQYYADETKAFAQANAKYAGNYIKAEVQGIDADKFFEWQTQLIRMADVSSASATAARPTDDYKAVLFANTAIDYIPRGAKIKAMGSTWLVTNPQNISSSVTNTVVERCVAVWRHLDWYGNILSEPISVQKPLAASSSNDKQQFVLLTNGDFEIKCQYNDYTAELHQNSRIILGSGAYALRGVTDFIQEFTDDDNSVRLLEFTAFYVEPNDTDDMANKVAGGLSFDWTVSVTGDSSLTVGATAQFTAASMRNGKAVTNTAEHPINYHWKSSDDSIVSVSLSGLITAISEGNAVISATLEQNATKSASFPVSVSSSSTQVAFTTTPPETISTYGSATLSAAYYLNGIQTTDTVTWSFSGADTSCYTASISGNSVVISCWAASNIPLIVSASCNGLTISTNVELIGI